MADETAYQATTSVRPFTTTGTSSFDSFAEDDDGLRRYMDSRRKTENAPVTRQQLESIENPQELEPVIDKLAEFERTTPRSLNSFEIGYW